MLEPKRKEKSISLRGEMDFCRLDSGRQMLGAQIASQPVCLMPTESKQVPYAFVHALHT